MERRTADERIMSRTREYEVLKRRLDAEKSIGGRIGCILQYLFAHGGRVSISLDADTHSSIFHYSLNMPPPSVKEGLENLKADLEDANQIGEPNRQDNHEAPTKCGRCLTEVPIDSIVHCTRCKAFVCSPGCMLRGNGICRTCSQEAVKKGEI